jgi:hypothetical protein
VAYIGLWLAPPSGGVGGERKSGGGCRYRPKFQTPVDDRNWRPTIEILMFNSAKTSTAFTPIDRIIFSRNNYQHDLIAHRLTSKTISNHR